MSNKKDKIPYVPRIVSKEYIKVYPDGREVKRIRTINTSPTKLPEIAIRAMSKAKHPGTGKFVIRPRFNDSYTAGTRIVSNKPKFKNRIIGGKAFRKQVRSIPIRILSNKARKLIIDGFKDQVIDQFGRIKTYYTGFINTILKYPPEPISSFHPKKVKNNPLN